MSVTEALIVGGGISGLYTALKLKKANISYVLLEAKSRVGGRVAGQPVPSHPDLSIDLGPTWFWPHQNSIKQLLTQFGLEWFEQYSTGENLYHAQSEEAPSRIYNSASTITSYRLKGGLHQLIAALTQRLEQTSIKTEHAAVAIKKKKNIWQVSTIHQDEEEIFEAHQLVLALPPRLIVEHLKPEHCLSGKLVNDLQAQQTWMSGQAKFVAVYNKPFWREKNLSGDAFSHVGPMLEIHDASSTEDSGFALFGFLGLPFTVRTRILNEQLKSQCLAQLGLLFGPEALDIEVSYLKDWAEDRWVATDQDIRESPKHAEFATLRHQEELESLRLHLSASEFAQREAGYLEGALLAADAAVQGVTLYSQKKPR